MKYIIIRIVDIIYYIGSMNQDLLLKDKSGMEQYNCNPRCGVFCVCVCVYAGPIASTSTSSNVKSLNLRQ